MEQEKGDAAGPAVGGGGKKAKVAASITSSSSGSSSSSSPSSTFITCAPTLTDVALCFPGLFLDKIIPAVCGDDAKAFSRLDRVSKLFHAPSQIMDVEDGEGNRVKRTVSLVERALRRMSEQVGRGIRGVALPPTIAGPPLPNWTQVLLRELRRGFWQKRTGKKGAMRGEGGKRISGGAYHSLFVAADGAAYSCGGIDEFLIFMHDGTGNLYSHLGHGDEQGQQDVPLCIEALVKSVCSPCKAPLRSPEVI